MKLIETLTAEAKAQILSGNLGGIFTTLVAADDPFSEYNHSLNLGYYFQRSGLKSISPFFETLLEAQPEFNYTQISATIGTFCRDKFLDKWVRIFNALVTEQYDALATDDFSQTKLGTNTDTTTFGSGTTSDSSTAVNETTTRGTDTQGDVYGFNSPDSVPDTVSVDHQTQTTVADADKNTTHSRSQRDGTDTTTYGINETTTNKGRRESGASLINAEVRTRIKHIFFDIVYDDIDSVLTLDIY